VDQAPKGRHVRCREPEGKRQCERTKEHCKQQLEAAAPLERLLGWQRKKTECRREGEVERRSIKRGVPSEYTHESNDKGRSGGAADRKSDHLGAIARQPASLRDGRIPTSPIIGGSTTVPARLETSPSRGTVFRSEEGSGQWKVKTTRRMYGARGFKVGQVPVLQFAEYGGAPILL